MRMSSKFARNHVCQLAHAMLVPVSSQACLQSTDLFHDLTLGRSGSSTCCNFKAKAWQNRVH
jgi:hypothetical protein